MGFGERSHPDLLRPTLEEQLAAWATDRRQRDRLGRAAILTLREAAGDHLLAVAGNRQRATSVRRDRFDQTGHGNLGIRHVTLAAQKNLEPIPAPRH